LTLIGVTTKKQAQINIPLTKHENKAIGGKTNKAQKIAATYLHRSELWTGAHDFQICVICCC